MHGFNVGLSTMMRIRGASFGLTPCRSPSVRGLMGAVLVLFCGAGVWTIDSWSYAIAASEDDDGCPRGALREMMTSAAVHNDVGDVAALELEVLRLCNERQKLIVKVVEGEARLAELRGAKRPEHVMSNPETAMAGVLEDLPPPSKVSVQPGASGVQEPMSLPTFLESATFPRSNAGGLSYAELRWTTVYGSAGNWVAGITNGANTWYLRVGDELPSGERVESIRERPPGVRLELGGEEWQIPGPGAPGVDGKDGS